MVRCPPMTHFLDVGSDAQRRVERGRAPDIPVPGEEHEMVHGSIVRIGWVASSIVASFLALGCATSANASSPGELELVLGEGSASYALKGRFRLAPVDSSDVTAPDVVFDAPAKRVQVALPAGVYLLTLNDGARLDCPGDDVGDDGAAPHRRVGAWPQRIVVAPGVRTTARIRFDGNATEVSRAGDATHRAGSSDPCEGRPPAQSAELVLSGFVSAEDAPDAR
jgi:hypothetical protein